MDGRIAAHLREAQVGGVPGIKEKVRAPAQRPRRPAMLRLTRGTRRVARARHAVRQTLAYLKVLLAQLERTTPALLQRLEVGLRARGRPAPEAVGGC